MPTLGSLFDGIGGFPLAAVRNGITPLWASEIEPFPIEVTKLRFPDMLHVGDITKLDGAILPSVDIVTGGSPCQDLSVASGHRQGLAGARSGLFMEQIRIVKEMRAADERRNERTNGATDIRPRYMVWENVPGAFSSGEPPSEDFRVVIEEITRLADSGVSVPRPPSGVWQSAGCVMGAQFSVAWRVLDAQYWSETPQRRRRIFLVADFGGCTAPQILFEQHRLFGDTAQSEGARETTAAAIGSGVESASGSVTVNNETINNEYESDNHSSKVANSQVGQVAIAFAANQRDEVRELGDHSGALQAQPGMKQQTFIAETAALTPWDTQQKRIFTPESTAPTLNSADGGNPAGLVFAAGVVTKGNGDCFVMPDKHTALTGGGGQAGQGYPCVVTSGFSAGASPKARSIGFTAELSPTLKGSASGTNQVPSILCINDQGGERIDLLDNQSGTLRAQAKGHAPLVMATQQGGAEIALDLCPTLTSAAGTSGNNQPVLFENNAMDGRFNGPLEHSPTITARLGTGGNNGPLVTESEPQDESYCIAGNTIDRQPQNGGNGLGCQPELAYTVTAVDRHAVYNRQGYSGFTGEREIAATQTAHQSKDATDLVVFGQSQYSSYESGASSATLRASGGTNGGGSENLTVNVTVPQEANSRNLIRRLTPLECERLQGFPDNWTDITNASDSARYKALGNSVAIPCVTYVLQGIAYFLSGGDENE
jgi:DNA (cytosine-5)-methyltransferase 1